MALDEMPRRDDLNNELTGINGQQVKIAGDD